MLHLHGVNFLQINPILFEKKTVRWGYSCELKCLSDLLHEADAHYIPENGQQ